MNMSLRSPEWRIQRHIGHTGDTSRRCPNSADEARRRG